MEEEEEEEEGLAVFIRHAITKEEEGLSLLVNQSERRIRRTHNRRNTDPNHGPMRA